MTLVRRLTLVPLIALIAGCVPVTEDAPIDVPIDPGVTISGTVVGYYYDIVSPVTVTVTNAGGSASLEFTVVAGGGGSQAGSYTLTGVPAGPCTLLIQFLNSYSYYDMPQYSIDGGSPVVADSYTVTGSTAPYTHEVTFENVQVDADATIDVDLGNVG